MKKIWSKSWFVFFIALCLIFVKFYYLYFSNTNGAYVDSKAYSNGDAGHYLTIGKNLSDYGVYSDTGSNLISEGATWRPPLWPFVLSFFFKISKNLLILIALKFVLETALLFLAILKYKDRLRLKIQYFLPLLLIFVEPHYIKYSITFLSESLTAVLILMLSVVFLSLDKVKKHHILMPVLASLVILCHPVSVFFVMILFAFYLLSNIKSNFKVVVLHGIVFISILSAWPLRNEMIFDKGFYLTASQGATFSKGWNEKVKDDFTNVDGDLADETLNLKYVDEKVLQNSDKGVIGSSQLCGIGTKNFLRKLSFLEKMEISVKKLKSNFNPFPERPKPGFLENVSIFFRILYLITFLQMLYGVIKQKLDFGLSKDRIYLVVMAVFLGQAIMSVTVYTGLRFNSIYSLIMLFCFIELNAGYVKNGYRYISNIIFTEKSIAQ